MKKNSIIITHFVGDGGNFLINALSMSKYVGHPFPTLRMEEWGIFLIIHKEILTMKNIA